MTRPTLSDAVEFGDLAPEQQAQVAEIFAREARRPMTDYTYVIDEHGQVCGWRYYKLSPEAAEMINSLFTD